MTRDERITKLHKGRWIRYPRAEQILAQLDELLKHPKTHRMPNLLVFGETNNGKTALIQRFVQQHLPKLGDDRTLSRIPVVVIQAPPVPEERRFYQAILSQVFAPFRPSSSIEDLQHETLRMLMTINVKMLIIDEIHHVLAGPLLKQRHFLNVIKYMGNELQIPLVAAGTHDAFNAIQIDPQLANRFEPALLPHWSMNEDYLRLLASFEPALRLERPSNLIDPVLATKILTLSGGTIGEISTLLTRAASRAIDDGSECITNATLDACGYVAPSERRRVALGI
jgi:hypothetical protein